MGYQVGNICYATKQEAENAYFSLVVPVIATQTNTTAVTISYPHPSPITNPIRTNKVSIIAPEYKSGKWYLNGQQMNAQLPQCDAGQNFRDGAQVGWLVFGVMAALYVILIVKRLLR